MELGFALQGSSCKPSSSTSELSQRRATTYRPLCSASEVAESTLEPQESLSTPVIVLETNPTAMDPGPRHHMIRRSFEEFLSSEKELELAASRPPVGRGKKKDKENQSWYARKVLLSLSSGLSNLTAPEKHPSIIVIGQLFLLTLAWSFYLVLLLKESIPLPFYLAIRIRNDPTTFTLVLTLISTAISALSSLMLSLSIRYAANYYLLRRSLKVYTLGSTIKMLNNSVIFDPLHPSWTFITLGVMIAVGTQTAGWSALMTPVPIITETPVKGLEVEITDNPSNAMYFTESELNVKFNRPETGSLPSLMFSGFNGLTVQSGQPTMTNLNGWNFLNTTAGVLPPVLPILIRDPISPDQVKILNTSSQNSSTWSIPIFSLTSKHPLPQGFATNLVIHDHQGFTADVSCSGSGIQVDIPPLNYTNQIITIPNPDPYLMSSFMQAYEFSRICGNTTHRSNVFYVLDNSPDIDNSPDMCIGLACPIESEKIGPTANNIIIYMPNALHAISCNISTQVTVVEVDYNNTATPKVLSVRQNAWSNNLSDFIITELERLFWYSQRTESNDIFDLFSQSDLFAIGPVSSLEAFIKGFIEYTISNLRGSLPPEQAIWGFANHIQPPAQVHQIAGTYYTSTIGFGRRSLIALLPITVVGVASLCILSFILFKKRRDNRVHNLQNLDLLKPLSEEPHLQLTPDTSITPKGLDGESYKPERGVEIFDVGDPFHLLAVASAGGIAGTFGDKFSEIGIKMGHAIRVKLGRVDEEGGTGRVGLVHA
ncbi:hypothetical protein GALMADRAFT_243756 [Galerina marginata CBS 339.88]|uniref:Uncharacterized protein n=1 Tax=Galerina marginata (strain CBS 339.88) TaxID=685588 RepID=A0A067TID2_GALM3|nr:hypothetical protein GALMADRAFT_243756 [Galerina marginata CBS 339.88]